MSGDDSEFFSESIATQEGPIHSTPIKDSPFKRPLPLGRVTARVEPSSPVRPAGSNVPPHTRPMATTNRSLPHSRRNKSDLSEATNNTTVSPGDNVTVQKQRREIQLLVQELRDRDNELNETASAHSQQLLAWERDRQRLLTLEQKCARYEGELHKKRKQLEVAMAKLRTSQSQEEEKATNLSTTEQQLNRLSLEKQHRTEQVDNLEKQNVSLNDSLKVISGTVGQLQAREQELVTLLTLKEREIEQATGNMSELNARVQQLDVRCRECQNREAEALHRATQWKQKYTQARTDLETLTGTVASKDEQLCEQGKEIGDLHQQLIALQEELLNTSEQDRRKNEIIESLRSKQDRTFAELRSVRELYERQQREITLMQLNFDSSKENSNQNSHMDESIAVDDSIVHKSSNLEGTSHPTASDNKQLSFEDRLSSFLDEDTDTGAVCRGHASPATKLQRLLTESRMMIESLEKSTVPAAPTANVPAKVQEVRPTNFTACSPQKTLDEDVRNISPVREMSDSDGERLHSPVEMSRERILSHFDNQPGQKFYDNVTQESDMSTNAVPHQISCSFSEKQSAISAHIPQLLSSDMPQQQSALSENMTYGMSRDISEKQSASSENMPHMKSRDVPQQQTVLSENMTQSMSNSLPQQSAIFDNMSQVMSNIFSGSLLFQSISDHMPQQQIGNMPLSTSNYMSESMTSQRTSSNMQQQSDMFDNVPHRMSSSVPQQATVGNHIPYSTTNIDFTQTNSSVLSQPNMSHEVLSDAETSNILRRQVDSL